MRLVRPKRTKSSYTYTGNEYATLYNQEGWIQSYWHSTSAAAGGETWSNSYRKTFSCGLLLGSLSEQEAKNGLFKHEPYSSWQRILLGEEIFIVNMREVEEL